MTIVRKSRRDVAHHLEAAPLFVLVRPQMGENVGACARAMLNFGLSGLRLVDPRDGWPNERAGATASGASIVLDETRVFETTPASLSDCQYVVATTARPRELTLPVLTPAQAIQGIKQRIDDGQNCAVMFGGERAGLDNEDIACADAIVQIPVNPAFASLNLAQAALVIAYEWGQAIKPEAGSGEIVQAPKEDFERFFAHLVQELDEAGYFFPDEKRPNMVRNLKVAFQRAGLSENEVRAMRGMIKALVKRRDQ